MGGFNGGAIYIFENTPQTPSNSSNLIEIRNSNITKNKG